MFALIRKEFKSQFASPLFVVTAALFLFLTGFAFTAHLTGASPHNLPEASMRGMIYFMAVILLFISPLFTMRAIAEERKSGTLELLKTAPLSDLQIVLAKFLALFFLMILLLLLTAEFPIFLFMVGAPDVGPMLLSYLGLILLGGAFLSVGIFCSSLTSSQMLAAILSFVSLLTLWFLADLGSPVLEEISVGKHLESFSLGVLHLTDLAYYLFFAGFFIFLTIRKLESERWK